MLSFYQFMQLQEHATITDKDLLKARFRDHLKQLRSGTLVTGSEERQSRWSSRYIAEALQRARKKVFHR